MILNITYQITQMRVSVCTLWKYYLMFDVMLLDKDIISNFLENSESLVIFTVWKNGQTNAFDLGNLESSPEILLVHKVCKICRGNTISPIHILIHHMYIRLKFPKFFKTFPKHLKFYLHCCTYKFCCTCKGFYNTYFFCKPTWHIPQDWIRYLTFSAFVCLVHF